MEKLLEQLKLNLAQATAELKNNKSAILQLLLNNGGKVPLSQAKAEQKYNTLENDLLNAKIEIIGWELDLNNPLYEQLIISANAETASLKAIVKRRENIDNIINSVTSVLNFILQIKSLGV